MEQYIGKMLDNRYEILEVIGTGGMSVVFKAKCHRLNRLVAIKMLKKDLSEDAEFRRRFHDESQAVAMLSHPNIMAVYDVSRGGDMDYIVMELIDGITLKQYIERRGKLNWPEALHFITQIMKGLSHAHSRGIIHRDIKPQNIMVLRDGTVKVTDFGIACLSNGSNPSNEAIGSVHYISPEQAKGDYTDNRSDIYSAGVVLYEMLTSRLPFDGDNPMSIALQHISSIPVNPREINPDIPEAMEQICLKAMAPDRNRRYSTAEEMIADLEAFRKDPTISFDYSAADMQTEQTADEPTQFLPNMAAAKNRKPIQDTEPEKTREEERMPVRTAWWKVLLLIIVLIVGGYFAVTSLYEGIFSSFSPSSGTSNEYSVPSLIGMTVEEAQQLDTVSGIFTVVEAYYEYSDAFPAGQIMNQDPPEGRSKKSANGELIPINVTVSNGAKSGGMPYLIGEEPRNAKIILEQTNKELAALHLKVVESPEQEYSDTIPEGYVLRTEPEATARLSEGDTVTLIISKGPETVTMIPCVGESIESVQQLMNQLGLTAVFESVEGSAPVGQVLSQSVDIGEEVAKNSTVTFTYSDGEKLLEHTVKFQVPFSFFKVDVEIYLDNTQVFSSELSGDYGMLEQKIFAKAGSYQLKIYVNDQLREDRVIVFSE